VLGKIPSIEQMQFAARVAERIFELTAIPFELHAFTSKDAIGTYIHGTSGFPVILIDLEAHVDYEDQIGQTIYHELEHSLQEFEGRDFNEDEAEDHRWA
jgi:hypothetical protein